MSLINSALALSQHYSIRLNYALLACFAVYVVKNDLDGSCAWYTIGLLMSYMAEASTFNESYKLFHRSFLKPADENMERNLSLISLENVLKKNLNHVYVTKIIIFVLSNILEIVFSFLLLGSCNTLQYSVGLTLVLTLTVFRSAVVIPIYSFISFGFDVLNEEHATQRKELRYYMEN